MLSLLLVPMGYYSFFRGLGRFEILTITKHEIPKRIDRPRTKEVLDIEAYPTNHR